MTAPATVVLMPASVRGPGAETSESKAIGSDRPFARLVVDVSAVAAGGSVTLRAETARTLSGGYTPVGTCTRSEVGAQELLVAGLQGILRVVCEVTAGATFDVTAATEQSYCSPQDVAELSSPPGTLSKVSLTDQALACVAATDEAVSYLAAYFDMPLTRWGNALRLQTSNMAAFHVMKRRGMNRRGLPGRR